MSGRPSWKSAEIGLFRPFSAFFSLFQRVRRAAEKSRKRRKKAFFLRYPQIRLNPHLLNPYLWHSKNPPGRPTREGLISVHFGSVWLRFGSVSGLFRLRFRSVSGVLGGVVVGSVRGASVREKNITNLAAQCEIPPHIAQLDDHQITHLICVRLKLLLYDFLGGCFGPPSCCFPYV